MISDERIGEIVKAMHVVHDVVAAELLLDTLLAEEVDAVNDVRVLRLLGNCHNIKGNFSVAIEYMQKALMLRPRDFDLISDMGIIYYNAQQYDKAAEQYKLLLSLGYTSPIVRFNLGNTYAVVGQALAAMVEYRQAIVLDRDMIVAYRNIVDIAYRSGLYYEAMAYIYKILELTPNDSQMWELLSDIEFIVDADPALVEQHLKRAIACGSTNPTVYTSLYVAIQRQNRVAEALRYARQAVEANPDNALCQANLGIAQLSAGDWTNGLANLEARLQVKPDSGYTEVMPKVTALWDGKASLTGRQIVLRNDQGFGDIIQYIRFIPHLRARGATTIIMEAIEQNIGLYQASNLADKYIPYGDEEALQAIEASHNYHIPIGSLAYLLKIWPGKGECWNGPYLAVPDELVAHWASMLPAKDELRIGIAWRGNPTHYNDKRRSCRLHYFKPIAKLDGVQLIALQQGIGIEEVNRVDFQVHSLPQNRSWLDTAAIIKSLDLVVSIDTGIVHVAGALEARCYVMLGIPPDYRWECDRITSTWYPSIRLFRQYEVGNWPSVFNEVTGIIVRKLLSS